MAWVSPPGLVIDASNRVVRALFQSWVVCSEPPTRSRSPRSATACWYLERVGSDGFQAAAPATGVPVVSVVMAKYPWAVLPPTALKYPPIRTRVPSLVTVRSTTELFGVGLHVPRDPLATLTLMAWLTATGTVLVPATTRSKAPPA